MASKRVMLIDDDADFLEEFGEMLKSADYDVISVHDGSSAVGIARKEKPDVILIDHRMKPKRGFQIAYELQGYPETCCIPVVAMTGYDMIEEQQFLMCYCGIKKCLRKPFRPLNVVAAIEEV